MIALVAGWCLLIAAESAAQDAQGIRRELGVVRNLARRAADLQHAGKLEAAAAALSQSQDRLAKVLEGASDETRKQAQPAWQSLQASHAALQLEGVTLPSLQPLTALMTAADAGVSFKAAVAASPAVQRATGEEQVSFSRELAGVLVERCLDCHGAGRNVRAQFNLSTFTGLLRGGDKGPPVMPGRPTESLLIQKLKGTGGGERMPQGGPPLADEVITQFETWIQEGARFDRADANQNLELLAAVVRAEQATDEQLRADRDKLAAEHWRVVLPGTRAERVQTADFLLLGNVSDKELGSLREQAEALVPRIARLLKLPGDARPLKGGATLYFFRTGYDYGEFGRMAEQRELPPHWRAHFGYDVVDAYAAFHLTGQNDETRETLLAQQIASLYVAAQGAVPTWFAQGVGQAVAARLVGSSPLVSDWMDSAQAALPRLQAPGEFLQGRPSAEEAEVLRYRYADFLLSDMRRFQKLLEAIRAGRPFAESFEQAYGGSPEQVAVRWYVRESQRGNRGR